MEENFISLQLLNILKNSIKIIQLKNIQLKDKNIFNNIPNLDEIVNKVIKKVIIDIPCDLFEKKERENNDISEFNDYVIINEKEIFTLENENEYKIMEIDDFKQYEKYNEKKINDNSKIKKDNNNDFKNKDININNKEEEINKKNSSIQMIKSSLILNSEDIEDKQIHYFRNSFTNNSNQYEFIDENENQFNFILNNGKIRYMTIDLFIKKIAIENFAKNESFLVSGFINQFCDFIDINTFINKIINAFHYYYEKNNEHALINLIFFLNNCVIEIYDFFRIIKFSNPLYSILTNFYNEIINKNKIKLNNIEKILILFERENILEENLRYIKEIFHEDKKIEKKQLNRFYSLDININHNKTFSILNYEKNEILNHLTFLSKNYFYEIDKKELLNSKFSKKNKEKDSPNIIKLINNSNNLANIIKVNILSEKNIQNRAKIIEKWIIISDLCKKINNFNDCFTINLALNSYMISSLLKTWKKVDETYISLFNEIKEFCSPISNFKYLREAIKNCINCPYLPFLGVYLKDFTNYNELYKYIKNDKLINFMKINLIERSIQDFFKYKNIKYNINPVYKLDFFENIKSISEEELDYLYNKIKDK